MNITCKRCGSGEHRYQPHGNGDIYRTCECGEEWHEDGETVWSMCPCGGTLNVFRDDGNRRTQCGSCHRVDIATNGTPKGSGEATCVDNTGMEDKFTVGVLYVFEWEGTSTEMVWVYDNTGKARLVFKERFGL